MHINLPHKQLRATRKITKALIVTGYLAFVFSCLQALFINHDHIYAVLGIKKFIYHEYVLIFAGLFISGLLIPLVNKASKWSGSFFALKW